MLAVYVRCNGGHYFRCATACPLDGWSIEGIDALVAAVDRTSAAEPPSIKLLRSEGITDEVIRRSLVIDFGSEEAVFDAMEPAGYLLDHEWKPLSEAGPAFS